MKKLKLNVELLRVQSFDTGGRRPGHATGTNLSCISCPGGVCAFKGTVEALADTDDCPSKKADTMCEPPPSGQQACFMSGTCARDTDCGT